MDNLMKLMGAGSGPPKDKGDTSVIPKVIADPDAQDVDAGGDDEGFKAAASEAMDALSSGDVDAFSDALKSCIEMFSP